MTKNTGDNIIYNIVTILHNKMKGVAAYQKYEADFEDNESLSQLLETIQQDDEEHIEKLQQELGRLLQNRTENASESENEGEETNEETSQSRGRSQTQSASR